MIETGLDRLISSASNLADKGRLGLLYNQSSTNRRFETTELLIAKAFPGRLQALFGPQHGVFVTEQDNMRETEHVLHPVLKVPIFSLYSETRRPKLEMLDNVDTMLVDLQDVGTRVYTFATTVLYVIQACADADKEIVILDRPNPINGVDVEGNVLQPELTSFVGPFPIPMRHGMTLGELMLMYNSEMGINARLSVIQMRDWNRSEYFDETGLPWIMPSPNMPCVETAVVYPGMVALEGTNLSEGRGTTKPFEIFGAPYLDTAEFMKAVDPYSLEGVVLQPFGFKPTFNKWADQSCGGFFIHVVDRSAFKPYRFGLGVLSACIKAFGSEFKWSDPPYEYVWDKKPIDVILGDKAMRIALETGKSIKSLEKDRQDELRRFLNIRRKYLLY